MRVVNSSPVFIDLTGEVDEEDESRVSLLQDPTIAGWLHLQGLEISPELAMSFHRLHLHRQQKLLHLVRKLKLWHALARSKYL